MKKKILGLDLGTNSIGWALIEHDFDAKDGQILGIGSRIIPMSQDQLSEFDKGNSVSQTAERTGYRGVRRLRQRHLLRRERLLRVLNIMGFLPSHFSQYIDFDIRPGKFFPGIEPKIPYSEGEFIFKDSFNDMLNEFKIHQPHLLTNKNGEPCLVPYDWTIYYLRKKALKSKIEKDELTWIILNFNQKRGYYQLRGEESESNTNKLEEFYKLKVIDVYEDEPQKGKKDIWYNIVLENGWIYRRSSKISLNDWLGKEKEFIVTTDLNEDGSLKTNKEGEIKRSFRSPKADDWTLLKKKTESEINQAGKTVGEYIYETLLSSPNQKIRGQLISTIERYYYKDELKKILETQKIFHPELNDESIYNSCVRELYKNNEAHQNQLSSKDLNHLILNDIIFYQRPLRSKKSLISNCPLEFRTYKDKEGNKKIQQIKVIPKSHPLYQEFRIWQWIYNLNIISKEDESTVTNLFLNCIDDYECLFDFLHKQRDINQTTIVKYFLAKNGFKGKSLNEEVKKYRWNYVEDKKYPCNETYALILKNISKISDFNNSSLNDNFISNLWHILYSVTDNNEYLKALETFARKHKLDPTEFKEAFKNTSPFKSEYGAYSEKAIKKLLPLMRIGKYWEWDKIDQNTQERIDKIITGEYDENIKDRVRIKAINLSSPEDFQGLQLWLAQYIVYNRHSESGNSTQWKSITDLNEYIESFKQHSLRNPIVEQVTLETLRVVKDIWQKYGGGTSGFFDEIHIELGREMKNTADERKRLSQVINENENTNLRIKSILEELALDSDIENIRPYSPSQQEILKIYEEGVLKSGIDIEDDIAKISKSAQPSSSEIRRYRLWLEQKYRSPYTGAIIPLSKLFTAEYEIEHIIPQSRYFDDSFSNKVICEASVNKLKDNQLGMEFILQHHGEIVEVGFGKKIKIFEPEQYKEFINLNYNANYSKRTKLLLEEIPEKMIERQLNDTRYISKFIYSILSNVVRSDANDDGVNSINIVPVNGKITNELKNDWGLNDVWNDLILPRFERLNELTESTEFTTWNERHQKFLPTVPLNISKGFSKKRIDHRHHALDALVIACTTRDHVNLLNNQYAKSPKRYDLSRKLKIYKNSDYTDYKTGLVKSRSIPLHFIKPWNTFTQDANNALNGIIVSFKQNIRVINKASNYYVRWEEKTGVKKKVEIPQEGTHWAIRKPLHRETISGMVNLPFVKVPKGKICTASRQNINPDFDYKKIATITDTGIQKILKNYLESKGGDTQAAFSPEGLEDMNHQIHLYNDGKLHKPIFKVRTYEVGSKFAVGQTGNKSKKYAEAAKGTNLYFAIYSQVDGKRSFATVPLNEVIERQKQGLLPVPEENEKGDKLLFWLSPGDLVIIEDQSEFRNIYKFVSCTGSEGHFVPNMYAREIIKNEMGTNNKSERPLTLIGFNKDIMIKQVCQKIKLDRLGNLIP